MMKAILVSRDPEAIGRVYASPRREAIESRVELHPAVVDGLRPEFAGAMAEADVAFSTWGMLAPTEAEIEKALPRLRAVFYGAGSVQGFARPFLARGVRVYSAWHANAVPVAQVAVSQILLSAKGYFRVQPLMRESAAAARERLAHYPGNYGLRAGLLGLGAVGSKVAESLVSHGIEVVAFDPYVSKERAESLGVRLAGLDEIFASCMIVSNHLANNAETAGILRREHFLSMPPHSTFINTGRGPQLREGDLYDALIADPTRTALLDVLTDEGEADGNPLRALPNCLITPHMAGPTGREVRRMGDYMIEAFDRFAAGEPCPYEVTIDMLNTLA